MEEKKHQLKDSSTAFCFLISVNFFLGPAEYKGVLSKACGTDKNYFLTHTNTF
jgi:hypothetical protein